MVGSTISSMYGFLREYAANTFSTPGTATSPSRLVEEQAVNAGAACASVHQDAVARVSPPHLISPAVRTPRVSGSSHRSLPQQQLRQRRQRSMQRSYTSTLHHSPHHSMSQMLPLLPQAASQLTVNSPFLPYPSQLPLPQGFLDPSQSVHLAAAATLSTIITGSHPILPSGSRECLEPAPMLQPFDGVGHSTLHSSQVHRSSDSAAPAQLSSRRPLEFSPSPSGFQIGSQPLFTPQHSGPLSQSTLCSGDFHSSYLADVAASSSTGSAPGILGSHARPVHLFPGAHAPGISAAGAGHVHPLPHAQRCPPQNTHFRSLNSAWGNRTIGDLSSDLPSLFPQGPHDSLEEHRAKMEEYAANPALGGGIFQLRSQEFKVNGSTKVGPSLRLVCTRQGHPRIKHSGGASGSTTDAPASESPVHDPASVTTRRTVSVRCGCPWNVYFEMVRMPDLDADGQEIFRCVFSYVKRLQSGSQSPTRIQTYPCIFTSTLTHAPLSRHSTTLTHTYPRLPTPTSHQCPPTPTHAYKLPTPT